MPELPEVESIRRQLQTFIVGHTIKNVLINYGKKFEGDPKHIINAKIANVHRFGKVLEIELANKFSIVIHVKMTGQLIYQGPNLSGEQLLSKKVVGGVPGKHTHVIFELDKGGILYFNDVRKFGWIKITETDKVHKETYVGRLGFEPLKDLTFEKFSAILSKSKKPIKILLMDQEKIAGVGNIYANDALWLAKIHPKRQANALKPEEQKKLFKAVEHVLKTGIKYGGSSENSYVTPNGGEGAYQHHTLVYGKEGVRCERCKKENIEKMFLSGRGTFFCSFCQQIL